MDSQGLGGGASALVCTVRDCGAALAPSGRTLRCVHGHSFDVARRGYVNLLQPQDRRSLAAGDSADSVAARARLLARGVGGALFDDLAAVVRGLGLPPGALFVELGSGTGDLLRRLIRENNGRGIGLDLSAAGSEHAARAEAAASPETAASPVRRCTWVVANADRRLPVASSAAALVVSVHGRRNVPEVARVLAPGGYWLIAVPGADDLCEVRAAARGEAAARERLAGLELTLDADGASAFTPERRGATRALHDLDSAQLADLCAGTYRAQRRSEAERLGALPGLAVTLHSDWLLARRRAQ